MSVSGGCDFDLEALIAIQKESDIALTVVHCARAHHQLTPDAPPATMGARVCRFMPMQVVRKGTNWVRTFRNGRVKNCRPVVLSKWLEANPDDDLCAQAAELRHELMSNI